MRRDLPRMGASSGQVDFIWVEMRCRPLEQVPAAEAEVVAVMRDVTDRKMQEQALDLARSAAEAADAAKTRFLATMSHELRTPLNAIIGFSEMIVQEDLLMLDAARRKEYAQLINDSGQHLLSVVNGILDMSKMESGNFEIAPEPFAPRAALINCCNLLALKARENGIELATDAPLDLPVITGDPRAFKQIVINLVSNAVKFTERGGKVTVAARSKVRASCCASATMASALRRTISSGSAIPSSRPARPISVVMRARASACRSSKAWSACMAATSACIARIGEGTTVTVALPLAYSKPEARSRSATLRRLRP